jgi:hypothetical protein
MQTLSDVFGDRIIRSGVRPAYSTYLNLCDFSFWDCSKDKVYNSKPRTEEELKENIRKEMENIPAEQLQSVRGISLCRGTAFSTSPVISEQRQELPFIPKFIGHQTC